MPRINLLPWREEERKKRQREFGVAAAGRSLPAYRRRHADDAGLLADDSAISS